MKFNNFIDKTLKAAKQSAQQIYGDDFSKLKEVDSEDDKEDERSFSDRQNAFEKEEAQSEEEFADSTAQKGVVFERSGSATQQTSEKSTTDINGKLDSIRKYAAEQSTGYGEKSSSNSEESRIEKRSNEPDEQPEIKIPKPVSELYSRKDIRPRNSAGKSNRQKRKLQQTDSKGEEDPQKKTETDSKELYDQLVKDLPNGVSRASESSDQEEQTKDKQDLQNRLERLELLVEGKLSLSGDERANHPIYHKLMERGVPQQLISSWFDAIKQEGIDPDQQHELFQSKMLHMISKRLQTSQAGPAAKMLLFTGRSGSGKSHLILKLVTLSHFLETDDIAVVSFVPDKDSLKQNYSMVKPFCHDNNIDFYQIENAKEAAKYSKKWKSYDYILFETTALETGGESLISSISKLKDELQSQATVETHYLVNTSVQGIAFNDPLAKEVAADHVTLTHIDRSTKWGKAIPLLFNTDYKLRYISCGPSLSGDLLPFDAKKFTRKLLRA